MERTEVKYFRHINTDNLYKVFLIRDGLVYGQEFDKKNLHFNVIRDGEIAAKINQIISYPSVENGLVEISKEKACRIFIDAAIDFANKSFETNFALPPRPTE